MTTVTATGRIVSTQGWAVTGATVTALGTDGQQVARASCVGDGGFVITGLNPGPMTLLVAAPAHEPKALPVVVPQREQWDIGDIRIVRQGAGTTPRPGVWTIDTVHSTLRAKAHHFGLGGVSGGFDEFSGVITVAPQIERSTVDVQIVAASINTGNRQRDDHLRSADFLNVEQYPVVRYVSHGVQNLGREWLVQGELTMAGTTHEVPLTMEYVGSGPDGAGGVHSAYTATTELRRKDFNMNWNQAVGAGIDALGTTLRVTIDIEAAFQG